MGDEYITVITTAPGKTMGDAALAVEMSKFLLEQNPAPKKIRLIIAVDKYEEMAKHKNWLSQIPEGDRNRFELEIRVFDGKMAPPPVTATSIDMSSPTLALVTRETEASIKTRRDLIDPINDFKDSSCIIGYPMAGRLRQDLQTISTKNNISCCFIGAYNYEGGNPLSATVLSSGFNAEMPGFFIPKSNEVASTDLAPTDQTKLKQARSFVKNEHVEYFGYSNSDTTAVLEGSQADVVSFLHHITGIEKMKAARQDVLVYCKTSDDISAMLKASPELITHYGKIICDGVEIAQGTNADLPTLHIANVFPVEKQTFGYLLANTEPFALITGNASFIEAIFAGKIPVYQCMQWNKELLHGMIELNDKMGPPNTLLADFLRLSNGLKPIYSSATSITLLRQANPNAEQLAIFYHTHENALKESVSRLQTELKTNFDVTKTFGDFMDKFQSTDPEVLIKFYEPIFLARLKELKNSDPDTLKQLITAIAKRDGVQESTVTSVIDSIRSLNDSALEFMAKKLAENHKTVIFDEFKGIHECLNDNFREIEQHRLGTH